MAELKRRQVLRVGVAYLAAAWLLIQVAETLLPVFGFPATAMRVLVVVLAIGLVVALVLSWYFELTPEGIRPDKKAPRDRQGQDARTRRFDRGVGIVLLVAVAYFAFDKFVLAPQRTAELAQEARETGRSEGAIGVYGENSIAVLPFDDLSPEGN